MTIATLEGLTAMGELMIKGLVVTIVEYFVMPLAAVSSVSTAEW